MRRPEKAEKAERKSNALVRVLRPGEALLVDRHVSELEIVLFRPLHPEGLAAAAAAAIAAAPATAAAATPVAASRRVSTAAAGSLSHLEGVRTTKISLCYSGDSTSRRDTWLQHHQTLPSLQPQDLPSGHQGGPDGHLPPPPALRVRGGSVSESAAATAASAAAADGSDADATAGLPSVAKPPLFFDTTACVFYDVISKTDYVATGRAATAMRGVHHMPHAVVVGTEASPGGYCNYNVEDSDGGSPAAAAAAAAHSRMPSIVASSAPVSVSGAAVQGDYTSDSPRHRGGGVAAAPAGELLAVNSGVAMAAGDGIAVSLRQQSLCSGILVHASLYTRDAPADGEKNVYYVVRKPHCAVPLCLVPVSVPDSRYHSTVSVMLRRVKVYDEMVWEISNAHEPLLRMDIVAVIDAMERRGLRDPANYLPEHDARGGVEAADDRRSHQRRRDHSDYIGHEGEDDDDEDEDEGDGGDDVLDTDCDGSSSSNGSRSTGSVHGGGSDGAAPGGSRQHHPVRPAVAAAITTIPSPPPAPPKRGCRAFAALLANVPVVLRQGRRQYNVGRPHLRGGGAGYTTKGDDVSTDEDDDILDDALRSVVPRYAMSHPIRYDDGAYNVGSRVDALVAHYAGHREAYGLERAGAGSRGPLLPPLAAAADRCQTAQPASDERPPLPLEFLADPQRRERRRSGRVAGHLRRGTVMQQSAAGRGRSGSKLRKGKDKKGGSLAKGKRKRKKKVKAVDKSKSTTKGKGKAKASGKKKRRSAPASVRDSAPRSRSGSPGKRGSSAAAATRPPSAGNESLQPSMIAAAGT